MGAHLIDGEFQSDKYQTTPRGKVPLSVKDKTALDLLWTYAQRRRPVDAEFSDDLQAALLLAGYIDPRRKIDVLDHGFVRLVDFMGSDLSVVRAARVSYDAAWRAGEDEGGDTRLIRYLWRNRHTTPFESVTFQFEVKAPIFVFRQWHRHRVWSYNELSARYRELPEEFYIPDAGKIGKQSGTTKQARDLTAADQEDLLSDRRFESRLITEHCERAFKLYRQLLETGWPRELARMVLPVNTYSHMFGTVNLLNLMKFLTLRCDAHAQYEIRVYADAMRELARAIAPVCIGAWETKD